PPFYAGPVAAQPSGDERLVALGGPGQGLLRTPAPRVQGPAERTAVVPDPEGPFDQAGDARQRPTLGREPGGHGALLELAQELLPLGGGQPRAPARRAPLVESRQPGLGP